MHERDALDDIVARAGPAMQATLRAFGISEQAPMLRALCVPLARRIAAQLRVERPCPLIAVGGAQGSGKSTITALLAVLLEPGFGAAADLTVFLAVPDLAAVHRLRAEQEHKLRHAMSDAQLVRFVQHFERITRHMLFDMPAVADVTVGLDGARGVVSICDRAPT